jgi:hypothetical protein
LEEKKSLKSPYLDNILFKTKQDPKKTLLHYPTSNHQIWLIPLVGDCKSTYLLKLGKKKEDSPKCQVIILVENTGMAFGWHSCS